MPAVELISLRRLHFAGIDDEEMYAKNTVRGIAPSTEVCRASFRGVEHMGVHSRHRTLANMQP